MLGLLQHRLTIMGDLKAGGCARKQLDAGFFAKTFDLMADGWLRQIKHSRGARHASFAGHGDKSKEHIDVRKPAHINNFNIALRVLSLDLCAPSALNGKTLSGRDFERAAHGFTDAANTAFTKSLCDEQDKNAKGKASQWAKQTSSLTISSLALDLPAVWLPTG
jgi:hypothetical protein